MSNSNVRTDFGLKSFIFATGVLLTGCAIGIAQEIAVSVSQTLPAGPMCVKTSSTVKPLHAYKLTGNGDTIGQTDQEGNLWWWNEATKAGKDQEWSLNDLGNADKRPRVEIEKAGSDAITIDIDNKPFTTLNFKATEPRVYLYPLVGPTGVSVTRDYIMRDVAIEKDNKRQDHPHHRSMWTAYGDVRVKDFDKPGYDFWAEPKDKPLPRQALKQVVRTASGPVFGQIEAIIEWQTPDGQRLFSENRTYTFFAGDKDARMIDVRNVFHFNDMDVKFGQTKEGGILSLRLAVTMDEKGVKTPSELHGRMVNSRDGKGMAECWSKPAEWCDYVGPLEGQQVGVAVFDHPANFRHPTTWHIRDYGLYTANPFMPADKDKTKDNSQTWKKGDSTEFCYRVVLHKGDTQAAHIADQWKLYSAPPQVNLK